MTWLLLALSLLLLFGGCGTTAGPDEAEYDLYFLVNDGSGSGPALGTEPYTGPGAPDPETLVRALLAGPAGEGLRSPFPRGVTFQGWSWDEEEPGNLQITLSEQYGGLPDMAQTLADACIVMTACQFPEIRQVEISSEGFWSIRPASRTLSPEQLDLEVLLP